MLSIIGRQSLGLGVATITPTGWIALCLAVGFIPYFARVTRAAVIVEAGHDYVDGLRVLGLPTRRIVVREVLPNVVPTLSVHVLLAMAIAIFVTMLIALPFMGATMDPNVRADIVYFTTKNGGGVFSTSSIAWCGSLFENGGSNNVSTITANVLRRFSSDEPLPSVDSETTRGPFSVPYMGRGELQVSGNDTSSS